MVERPNAWAGRTFTNAPHLTLPADPEPLMRFYMRTPFRVAPPRGVSIYHPEERPRPSGPSSPMEAILGKVEAAFEAEIFRLLGLWVSKCEPGLAWGPEGLLGLTLAGDPGHHRPIPAVHGGGRRSPPGGRSSMPDRQSFTDEWLAIQAFRLTASQEVIDAEWATAVQGMGSPQTDFAERHR